MRSLILRAISEGGIEEEGERALFLPIMSLFLSFGVFNTLSLLLARTYCARRALRRGQRGLYGPPLVLLAHPFFHSLSYRYFDRTMPSVPGRDPPKRRQLLQKTGAARRIIILYCHRRPLLLHHLSFCPRRPSSR